MLNNNTTTTTTLQHIFDAAGEDFCQITLVFCLICSYMHMQLSIIPGPSCSKLTTWLVNVSLKFQTLVSQICQYFLLKKCEKLLHSFCWKNVRSFCTAKASLIFSTKKISVFGYKVIKHLKSWPLNKLVKLTMLWTTGPWFACFKCIIKCWQLT